MSPRLYFAYGSNLSLAQMAQRCPSSYFYGRAILPDYQWQINQRGFANIVPRAGHCVHGLVYELGGGGDDEERLDRNEGVRAGYYSKMAVSVLLYEPSSKVLQMCTRRIVDLGGADAVVRSVVGKLGERSAGRLETGMLVYASERFVKTGEPREEYVERMNTGIRDGVAMGIPEAFFRNVVRGYIPERSVSSPPRPRRRERSYSEVPQVRLAMRSEDIGDDEVYYSGTSDDRDPSGYRRRTPAKSGDGWSLDEEEGAEYRYRKQQPLSRVYSGYGSPNCYAGNPIVRTVTPGLNWYRPGSRWSSVL